MKTLTIIGLVLILLGGLALAYQGITYTTEEQIVDVGPLQATKETEKTIPIPPILGGVTLAAGVLVLIVGRK